MTEHGARGLLVDDERAIRRYLRTTLSAHGYQFFEACDDRVQGCAVISLRDGTGQLFLADSDRDGRFRGAQSFRQRDGARLGFGWID